ncbi:MAG: hypothetical protein QOI41_3957 [Myxococcales bacterium]|nr:hypothetical protein [Myxococcales bacterium]
MNHHHRMSSASFRLALVSGLGTCALVVACSSSTSSTPAPTPASFSTAAAVTGAADTHCAGKLTEVSQAACHATPAAEDAGTADDAGHTDTDSGAPAAVDYGPTQNGSEGEDDDCKYHVKWQSTAVTQNSDVTFQIVATVRKDNSALAGAEPFAEIFLNETHPAPNTKVVTTETSPGTYTIGPVRFDASGNWNVRFHFNDQCTDSEESPHGHAAFFVKVP